jgi:hypothetical protein
MSLSPREREEARWAVLRFLAERQAVALPADVLAQRINRTLLLDVSLTPALVEELALFLEGMGLVEVRVDGLGSTKFYQATSAGVLAIERGALESKK